MAGKEKNGDSGEDGDCSRQPGPARALRGEPGAARSRRPRWEAGARPSQDGSAGPDADRLTRVPRPGRPVWPAWGQTLGGGLTWARSRGRRILETRPRRSRGLTGSLGRRPEFGALFRLRVGARVFLPSVRSGVGGLGAGRREEGGGAREAARPRASTLAALHGRQEALCGRRRIQRFSGWRFRI